MLMKTSEIINNKIDRLPKGYVFTYNDFLDEVTSSQAVIKALNRMAASGKIVKLAKGKFYKQEKTLFGELEPNQQQIVKDLLETNGKIDGYITGLSCYNKLGLTTQVSNVIQIGKNIVRASLKRGNYLISFVKQRNVITKENIYLLQILDSIRYIKKIPDTFIEQSCVRLKSILGDLNKSDIDNIVRLAMKYPPSTRALLGALLSEIGYEEKTVKLKDSLNSVTIYKYKGAAKILTSSAQWNIK